MNTSPLLSDSVNGYLVEYHRQLKILRDYQEAVNTRSYLLSHRLHGNGQKRPNQLDKHDVATERHRMAEAKREKQILQDDLTAFLENPPPPEMIALRRQKALLSKASLRGMNRLRAVPWWLVTSNGYQHLDSAPGPQHFQLTPPAVASEPSSPYINAELGEMNLYNRSSGAGGSLGIGATSRPSPAYGSLTFIVRPPVSGDLHVEPHVVVSGTVYVSAHDHWYTRTDGRLTITLGCRLFQSYLDAGPPIVIVNEHRWDDSAAYWVIDTFTPTASTTVVKDVPVLIDVWVSIEAFGRSDHALVEADFRNGADRHIRVPSIDLTLVPL